MMYRQSKDIRGSAQVNQVIQAVASSFTTRFPIDYMVKIQSRLYSDHRVPTYPSSIFVGSKLVYPTHSVICSSHVCISTQTAETSTTTDIGPSSNSASSPDSTLIETCWWWVTGTPNMWSWVDGATQSQDDG